MSKSLSVLLLFLLALFFNESIANDGKETTDSKDQTNNKELTDDAKEQAESQRDKDEEKETDTNEAVADGDSDDEKPTSGATTTKKNVSKKDVDVPLNTIIASANARLYTTECLDESKADFKDVDKIKNGDWDVMENDEIKKFALCYMVKLDLMSPQAVLKLDHSLGRVDVKDIETMDQIIDACLVTQERDIDTAWNYLKCYSDRVHKYPILIRDN